MAKRWDTETWVALSKEDNSQVVKLSVRLAEEPGPNELAELRSKAVGMFHVIYRQWGMSQGQRVTEVDVSVPPSTSTPPTLGSPVSSPS